MTANFPPLPCGTVNVIASKISPTTNANSSDSVHETSDINPDGDEKQEGTSNPSKSNVEISCNSELQDQTDVPPNNLKATINDPATNANSSDSFQETSDISPDGDEKQEGTSNPSESTVE